jgi:hypothetical protein
MENKMKKLNCYKCFWNKLKEKSENVNCIFRGEYFLISSQYKRCKYCHSNVHQKKTKCPYCWRLDFFEDVSPISTEEIKDLSKCKAFIKARSHSSIIQDLKKRKDEFLSLNGEERRKRACVLSECRPSQNIISRLEKSEPFLRKLKEVWGLTDKMIKNLFEKIKDVIINFQKQRFKTFSVINRRIFIACCFFRILNKMDLHPTQFDVTHLFGISGAQLRESLKTLEYY